MRKITYNIYSIILLFTVLFQGCKKDQEIGVNPYADAKQALGILFTSEKASPETGLPGEVVTLSVTGLHKFKDQFKLYINGQEADIVNLSTTEVDVRIPNEVSSGRVTVIVDNQIFSGPWIGVEGKAKLDVDFKIVNGFNSAVSQILPNSGGFIVTGAFTDFEKQATKANIINSIHYLNSLGQSGTGMNFRRSAIGNINAITKLANGQFMIGGGLTAFSKRDVGGLTRLNANGSLDTMIVSVINPDSEKKPLNGFDTVATFNGRLSGTVLNVFPTTDNGVIAVGNFSMHQKIDYNYSSRENRRYISTRVNSVAKMRSDGSLDSSFNVNNMGINGIINGAIQLNDGRIIIVGSFTNYNGKKANNIVCLKPNGEIDEDYTGLGANNTIMHIGYNNQTNKISLSGIFKNYKGVNNNGLILLNADGSVDNNFNFDIIDEGAPYFSYPLNNGRIFVQGSFTKYGSVKRTGMLILESNGIAKQEYNNLGVLSGIVTCITETTSSLGQPAILIGGVIFAVDGKMVGNIAKIELKN